MATWSQPDVEGIATFQTREAAREAATVAAKLDRHGYETHLQFVGAYDAWTVEGRRRSHRSGNPFVLRTDGTMRKVWP